MAVREPGKEATPSPDSAGSLILGFCLQNFEKILLFQPASQGHLSRQEFKVLDKKPQQEATKGRFWGGERQRACAECGRKEVIEAEMDCDKLRIADPVFRCPSREEIKSIVLYGDSEPIPWLVLASRMRWARHWQILE